MKGEEPQYEAGKNKVTLFIENCRKIKTDSSKASYKSHLNNFFRVIKKDPTNYITCDARKLENGARIDLLDKYQKDVKRFAKAMENRPPKSQVAMMSAVKKFLSYYYIDLPQRLWDELSIKGIPIVEKKTPTRDQLKFILGDADTKQKALFLMSSSSGTRIDELLSLKISDIDSEERMIRVKDITTKKKYSRTTFFTEEAKQYLKQWLDMRNTYIKNKKQKSAKEKVEGYVEERIFPFEYHYARDLWIQLIEKVGAPFNERDTDGRFVSKNGHYKYNEHCLRRFFKTNLISTGLSKRYLDYMIGQSPDLDILYTDDDQFKLKVKEQYDNYSHSLNVLSDAQQIKTEYGEKISMQDKHIDRLTRDNQMLKAELQDTQKQMEEMKKMQKQFIALGITFKALVDGLSLPKDMVTDIYKKAEGIINP